MLKCKEPPSPRLQLSEENSGFRRKMVLGNSDCEQPAAKKLDFRQNDFGEYRLKSNP
jgi:hypothetical protein